MGYEIERKFLVRGGAWRGLGTTTRICQGYLSTDPDRVVRVRVRGERGFFTVKGRAQGVRRVEVESELPLTDANVLLELCKPPLIDKLRHVIEHAGFQFEVDEFSGENAGLVIAELEVADEADFARALAIPPSWLGRDVSADSRLANSALSERPFGRWSEEERRALLE